MRPAPGSLLLALSRPKIHITNSSKRRTHSFSRYRNILEPHAPKWDYVEGERSRVPLWEIAPGCILWLPAKDQIQPETLVDSGMQHEPPDSFDRPVLCLDVDIKGPTSGLAYFAKMGAFSDIGGLAAVSNLFICSTTLSSSLTDRKVETYFWLFPGSLPCEET
jgi:hypothetical protein